MALWIAVGSDRLFHHGVDQGVNFFVPEEVCFALRSSKSEWRCLPCQKPLNSATQ